MPILIVSLIAAMAVFFVKSKPEEAVEPQEMVSIEEEVTIIPAEPDSQLEPSNATPLLEESESEMESESITPEESTRGVNTVSVAPESSGDFTPWMTPLALDTYIRHKNSGYSESFWQRGHWITAVEGRWTDAGQEFRIALDKIPDLNRWQWQYRVNQTTEDFAFASREFADQGFKLVHAQSFVEPTGRTKFQAVWQRELEESAPVVETTNGQPTAASDFAPGRTSPSSERNYSASGRSSAPGSARPLDVNNLQFR